MEDICNTLNSKIIFFIKVKVFVSLENATTKNLMNPIIERPWYQLDVDLWTLY